MTTLQSLFNKPIPSKQKEFDIIISTSITNTEGKTQDLDIIIEDKTNEKIINRTKFVKSIKSKSKVIDSIVQKIEKDDDIEPEKKAKIKKDAINKLIIKPSQKKKLKEMQTDTSIAAIAEIKSIEIAGEILENRLPSDKEAKPILKSNYFMNNRENFINFINNLLKPYRKEILEEEKETCESYKGRKKDR